MSQTELEEYASHFHSGEDINLYDFSKIDFESPFFMSLPASDRYNILNAARLRSRLRMGYSKEQLDGMFPDRMAFSKFQIERVKERNELTQRLMHLNGMVDGDFLLDGGGRIAGERGKEYILVKNEGVEGGWALGVVSNKQGTEKDNAIDLDKDENSDEEIDRAESDEDDFEDVAIEGLNRVPKAWAKKRKAGADYELSFDDAAERIAKKRKAVYDARKAAAEAQTSTHLPVRAVEMSAPTTDAAVIDDSLFVPDDNTPDEDEDDLFEDVLPTGPEVDEEDDDLQRAIAMSLEQPPSNETEENAVTDLAAQESDEDEGFDFQAALAESRSTKSKPKTTTGEKSPLKQNANPTNFGGPLPFESLNLGQSLLGKKKSKKVEEDLSGGFDRELGDDAFRKERPPQPVPEWFNAAPNPKDLRYTGVDRAADDDHITYGQEDIDRREFLRRHETREVVDLDAEEENDRISSRRDQEADAEKPEPEQGHDLGEGEEAGDELLVPIPSSQEMRAESPLPSQGETIERAEAEDHEKRKRDEEREQRYALAREIAAENGNAEPEGELQQTLSKEADEVRSELPAPLKMPVHHPESTAATEATAEDEEFEDVDWSESDHDQAEQPATPGSLGTVNEDSPPPQRQQTAIDHDEDEGEDFEDVDIQPALFVPPPVTALPEPAITVPTTSEALPEEEYDYLSSDEEELMRQLAEEAEEHARFTSSLHHQATSTEQAMRDFDAELKSLRSQQKRDRRDADEVTQTMIQECQILLRHFGLPYVTAPMEAEAQCAELVRLQLVDGIVTDDSDIFLFGGTRIYKNMFNAAKYVECYLSTDLEKEFLLDRRKLVRFAHLLGSDYTEGIPSVGPVTALEILTDFDDLEQFKTWADTVQLGRPQDLEDQLTTPFRRKFRKTVQKKIFLPTNFPDSRVDEAYLFPEVDSNPEQFQWGVPDLDKLRGYLMATVGWNEERVDEVLVPVIRDINRREVEGTQSNITRYFPGAMGAGAGMAGGGGGLNGIRGKHVVATTTTGDKSRFGKAQVQAEAMAPRNRTGKESGRMRNAYKRLRGEAERRRRRKRDGDEEDDDDGEEENERLDDDDDDDREADGEMKGLGGIIGIDGGAPKSVSSSKKDAAVNVDRDGGGDGDILDKGDEAADENPPAQSKAKKPRTKKDGEKVRSQTSKTGRKRERESKLP